jgi:hypothetical protein
MLSVIGPILGKGWSAATLTNTTAFYDRKLITAVKRSVVQARVVVELS